MMYRSFPSLSSKERIEISEYNKASHVLQPNLVFQDTCSAEIQNLRLNFQLGKPVYHLTTKEGEMISRRADNGADLDITQTKALQIASFNTGINTSAAVNSITELDQWIPRTKYLNHLPIYKIEYKNEDKTFVYVSSVTGEILNLNTNDERFWAWIGAIPHWIYFRDIRVNGALWSQLVIWLAFLGLIMTVTGIVTGLVRYKKKPKAKFKRFKNKWYNFHYYIGLFFGLFVFTWIFSGLMSMTPFDWTPSAQLNENESDKWVGENYTLNSFNTTAWENLIEFTQENKFKEITFKPFNGALFIHQELLNDQKLLNLENPEQLPQQEDYELMINSFSSGESVKQITFLTEYDNYYYSRHNEKELPVIKYEMSNRTYYVNPKRAKVIYKCETEHKLQRWVYNGLHSLDFSFIAWKRPLWDIVLIILLVGGTIISFTGTALGIKFIKRKIRKQLKKREKLLK